MTGLSVYTMVQFSPENDRSRTIYNRGYVLGNILGFCKGA